MIPIRDTIQASRAPLVVYALVAANVAAFGYEAYVQVAGGPEAFLLFLHEWALVPRQLVRHRDLREMIPLVTSMFLHGGLLHLGGNMLFLWVFGDNVEDRMGRARFLAFYLLCGVAAGLSQLVIDPMSPVPMLGASGAVAGVLGAYLVLFPGARVVTLVPFLFFVQVMELPAAVFLLIWLVFQNLVPAAATLPRRAGEAGGGVAYWAHIGGFLCGAALAWLFRARLLGGGEVRRRPPPRSRRIWVVYRR